MRRKVTQDMDRRTYVKLVGASSVAGITGLAGCTGGGGGGSQELTPGTAPGFPPFEFKEGGELKGFDIDLLTAVVEETDYTLGEWQEFEFGSLIPALDNENIDVIAAAMTINDDRDQTIDFTEPYYNADQAVLVREDGDFQPSAIEDLADRPVGAQTGTTGESQVQSKLIDEGRISENQYNSYGSYVLAVEDLLNGNIDAIVVDTPVANTFQADRPVTIAFTIETGERYGFGIREGASDVQSALNSGLETVQNDGTYEELTREWFGQ